MTSSFSLFVAEVATLRENACSSHTARILANSATIRVISEIRGSFYKNHFLGAGKFTGLNFIQI